MIKERIVDEQRLKEFIGLYPLESSVIINKVMKMTPEVKRFYVGLVRRELECRQFENITQETLWFVDYVTTQPEEVVSSIFNSTTHVDHGGAGRG